MKNTEILNALSLSNTKENKSYCGTLAKIAALMIELKIAPGYGFKLGPVYDSETIIKSMPVLDSRDTLPSLIQYQADAKRVLCCISELQTVKVWHESGSYTFDIPTGNAFYNYVLNILGAEIAPAENIYSSQAPTFSAVIGPAVIAKIKKALIFVGTDKLRPAFMGVLLDFRGNELYISATDAHRLYKSAPIKYDGPACTARFIIPVAQAKKIAQMKRADINEPFAFRVFEDNKFQFDTIAGALINENFPDYDCVIPLDNPYTVEVDRAELLQHIAMNLPAANKITKQIIMSINGVVKIGCFDIDFSQESQSEFNYISSDCPDMKISFNGKLLTEILSTDKTKTVKISIKNTDRAGIFAAPGNADINLLMPLQILKRF